jgi:hypothetical protein
MTSLLRELEKIFISFHIISVSLYVLFYMASMKPQTRTVTIKRVTPVIFNQLYLKHGKTLLCPCAKDSVIYKGFVSTTFTFHPVCSSTFVSEKWIKALYLMDASRYGVTDFRTTASSQVGQDFFF